MSLFLFVLSLICLLVNLCIPLHLLSTSFPLFIARSACLVHLTLIKQSTKITKTKHFCKSAVINNTDFELLSVLTSHNGDVKHLAFSPSLPLLLSASYDDTLKLWEEDPNDDDWHCANTFIGHAGTVWAMDWAKVAGLEDYFVSVGDDMSVRFWKIDGAFAAATLWKFYPLLLQSLEYSV